jgi:predicted RNase H-like HicB family nuclease
MQEYNNGISSTLMRNVYKGILNGQPQPNMLGGKRARLHPKAGLTQYDYPSTLAVGTRAIHQPNLLGAGFWQDFGKGFKQGLVGTAQVAAPIAGELAKEAALSYIKGGKRKGGKYSIGHFFNDAKDVLDPFAKQVVPVATNVASSVAKDAIKSYLSGGAMLSNQPSEFHNTVYPQALQSYYPDESHLYGGDLVHYWKSVRDLAAAQGITLAAARKRIKAVKSMYIPEAPKKRGPNKRTKLKKQAEAVEIFKSVVGSSKKKRKPKMTAGAMYDSDSDSDSDDDTMVGGDLVHYWKSVRDLAAAQGITLAAARKLIKANKSLYTPEARKPRGAKQTPIKGVRKAMSKEAISKLLSLPPKPKRTSKKKTSDADFGVGPEGVSAGSMSGGNWLDDVVKVSKAAAPYVVPLMMAAGRKPKRMSLPTSGRKREVARGDIVAAVMRQQGISLPQASKYVKDQGLY